MGGDDYKSLLFGYFTKFDSHVSEAYLNMFVVASFGYLVWTDVSSVPSTATTAILEKMICAAEIMSHCQKRRDIHGCDRAEDERLICQLYREYGALSESYAQLFRRLLHIFERSHCRGVLTGNQIGIRKILHRSLEAAHAERTCEVQDCPWISHQCPGTWSSDYRECPLLVTGEDKAGAHTDVDETSAPSPSTEPDARRARLMDPNPPVIAQATAQPSHPLHPGPPSPTAAIHQVPEDPTILSMDPTHIEPVNTSLVHQTASAAASEATSQPRIAPTISPESHLADQVSPPDEPSDSNTTKSPDGEARGTALGRGSPRSRPVASQQPSSVSATSETPSRHGDILDETGAHGAASEGTIHRSSPPQASAQSDVTPSTFLHEGSLHPAGPTSTGTMAPERLIVSDGRTESGSLHRPVLEHPTVDEGTHGEGWGQAIDFRHAGGRTGRAASVLFDGDMTASGQGAEEFELVTRGVCDVPGEGTGGLELDG